MLWSHSNRKTFERCPAWWNAYYREKTVKKRQTVEAARGDEAHQMLERFVHWRMGAGRQSQEAVLAWLKAQVTDLVEEDGLATSDRLDAAWIIEGALWPEVGPRPIQEALAVLERASSWGTEADWYFDAKWERWQGDESEFYAYARKHDAYGGIPDLWAVVADRLYLWDWKSGKRYPDWNQLRDYALFGALRFPEVEQVVASFVWLTVGAVDEQSWQRADLTNHRKSELLVEVEGIKAATAFPTSPGFPQCNWCPVVSCPDRKEKKR